MGQLAVGTSGFSYRDWVGPFYPKELPQREFLRYYSRTFSFVELNFSYYRQPESGMIEQLRRKVPGSFQFSIKAHSSITHDRGAEWKAECERFQKGIEPLVSNHQCAGVLMQFPYSFHYTRENRLYLDAVLEKLRELPLLVEFRNAEWKQDKVFEGLKDRSVGLVLTDMPELENLPVFEPRVTSDISYLRFHGRNKAAWWTGDNISRYDYLYSREELEEKLPDLRALLDSSRRLYLAFNNHHKGQAVQNALQILQLLGNKKDEQ